MPNLKNKKNIGDFIEASGLLEYDPIAIQKIYVGHPLRLIKRIWQTLIPISVFLFNIFIDKILGLLKDESRAKARAKEFTQLLVGLGPAFVKAGQALSTRPDIVPALVLEELAQLQDQLPAFSSELAMACIEEDLENSIKNIFESIDYKPISAASLGQVHKGILLNGDKVAVKVQRPGLREQITLDLYIVRNIAEWLNKNIGLIRSDLVALIDELGKRIFEEMDYLNEAKNAEKFAYLHSNNKDIAVPKIYSNYTSRRVLTMEWVDGVKLTNLEEVKNLGIDPNKMIEIGVNCSLQQLLEHGFFHADPHPGNLLALPDGRLCYLDFGMMSEVTRDSRTGLIQAVVHLVNRRFDKLSKDFVTLGFLSKEVKLDPIVPAFEKVFTQALEIGVNKLDFKAVTDDMSSIMYKFPFRVPPYYALIIRSLITLEGIALNVDPQFKILGAAYPYFAKRLMEDPDPELRKSLKEMLFDGDMFKWQEFDGLITTVSKEYKLDIDKLFDQVLEYIVSYNGSYLRSELIEISINKLDTLSLKIINKFKTKTKILFLRKSYIEPTKITKSNIQLKNKKFGLYSIISKIPNFKKRIIFKKIPKIIFKRNLQKMGLEIIQGLAERNMIRIVNGAAGK